MKKVLIYWLLPLLDTRHRKLIDRLADRGYHVVTIHNFEELSARFDSKRSRLVVVDEEYGESKLARELPIYIHRPEFSGVRFILNFTERSPQLLSLVAQLGFKDAIPFRLKLSSWIKRFEYSISTKDTPFTDSTSQVSMRDIADIRIPARITCISSKHIRLETKVKFPKGAKFRITGRFSDDIDVKSLSLTANEHYETGLSFRFSDAYVCEWSTSRMAQPLAHDRIKRLRERLAKRPLRVFAVVQSGPMRRALIDTVDDVKYDLSFALNQRSITSEPKYFNPEILIYEHGLIKTLGIDNFKTLTESLDDSAQIVIVGSEVNQAEFDFEGRDERLHFFDGSTSSLIDFIDSIAIRFRKNRQTEGEAYLQKHHPYSLCYIILPARITLLNPEFVSVATPFEIGSYNLIKIKSPFLSAITGNDSVIKVTSSHKIENHDLLAFPNEISGILADLDISEKKALAAKIIAHLQDDLQSFLPPPIRTAIENENSESISVEQIEEVQGDVTLEEQLQEESAVPIFTTGADEKSYQPIKKRAKKKTFLETYKSEINILGAVLFLFVLFISLIYLVREPPENQGKEFSDSYRRLYERYKVKDNPN